ncbi:Lrp/AsnC family transcriptional regulator [Thermococcus atlanticus]
MVQLDDLDRAILRLLKEDARLTISEIGEKLKKPESTIHFRIKKLQERGIIGRYTIVVGKDLQPNETAFVIVRVKTPVIEDFLERYLEYITRTLAMLPNVLMVSKSGDDTILVLVGEENEEKLNRFIEENINALPTLREVTVLPVREFKKGSDIIGFLAGV